MDDFLILAQWGGRPATASEVAAGIRRLAEAVSGSPAGWLDLTTRQPVPEDPDALLEWVEGTRSRGPDGTVYPDDGFWPSLITGDLGAPASGAPAVADIRLNAGRVTGNDRVAGNSVTVTLSDAWLRGSDHELPARIVRAVAEAFRPAWASAYDVALASATGRRIVRPRIGYVTYLSDATIERLAGAEAYRVSTLPSGVLLELPRPWSVEAGAPAAAALENASALRPVPEVEPAVG